MIKKIMLIFAIILSLFLIPSAFAMNYYQTDYYNWETTSGVNTFTPSFSPVQQTCSVRVDSWIDVTGSYSATETFYSPDSTSIATATWSGVGSNCIYAGFGNTSTSLNNNFEGMSNLVTTGGSPYNYVRTRLNCQTNDLYMNFSSNSSMLDSRGYVPLVYYGLGDYRIYFSQQTFKSCNANNSWNLFNPFVNFHDIVNAYATHVYTFIYPFNTSSGKLIYNFDVSNILTSCAGSKTVTYSWKLFNYNNPSAYTTLSSSGMVILPEDEQYVIALTVNHYANFPYSLCDVSAPKVDYSVYIYKADWSCGAWSECVNGTQTRQCTDINGITIPKNEFKACYTAPEESIFMGFEDYTSEDVFYCSEGFYFGCTDFLNVKSVDYPTGWGIGHSYDIYPAVPLTDNVTAQTGMLFNNIKMTTEEAKDSQYSLKMWYLPPEARIPYNNYPLSPPSNTVVSCINASYGSQPAVYNIWNQSIFVARNITFPSPFMTLSFDTLKCKDSQIEKKYAPAYSWIFPLCGRTDPECCCYSYNESCTRNIEDTSMLFRVRDTVNLSTPKNLDVTFQVTDQLNWKHHEYQMDNLQTNKTYQIAIELTTSGIQDTNDYCVYVDNVNLNTRNSPVVCESYCDGVTRYEATCKGYVGSDCTLCDFTTVEVSPYCTSQPDKVLSCTNWCDCTIGNGTLYNASSTSYGCAWTVYPNNPSCNTECVQQANENALYTPYINATTFGAGNEWVAGFFTPIFISLIVAIGLSAVIVFKIPAVGWQGFIITFFGILLVFSLTGLFPAWVYIVMIVFAGLIFASKFAGTVFQ